jgi:cell division protein FtsB
MNKIFNFQSIAISILLVALVSLVHTNNQILDQNKKLTSQVSTLNTQLNKVTSSAIKIEQRMAKIEDKLEPKFHGLLAMSK